MLEKKKKTHGTLKKQIVTILMAVAIMFSATQVEVMAEINADTVQYLEDHAPGGTAGKSDWVEKVAKYFSTTMPANASDVKTVTIGKGTGDLTVYFYNDADSSTIDAQIRKIYKSETVTEDVTNMMGDLKISADIVSASKTLEGFTPFINLILGLAVVVITSFMTVFTAIDICYIVFPVFRSKLEDSAQSGGINAKKTADGGTKMRFVTDEAVYAVSQATTNPGVNAMSIYFGKRVVSYIILTVMLFILLTDNISLITNIALKAVSGILSILQQI